VSNITIQIDILEQYYLNIYIRNYMIENISLKLIRYIGLKLYDWKYRFEYIIKDIKIVWNYRLENTDLNI